MSDSRPISMTGNNKEGLAVVDWTQVSDDAIRYDTNDKEETMRAKAKERKRQKAAEQAQCEEQARLEAERVEREQIEAKRAEKEKAEAENAEREAEEKRVREEEEKREAECKRKAEASKSDEAGTGGASGEAGGEVKRVVMDPGCTCCTRAQVICEFLIDSNKKWVACVRCNLSKGKCQWPGDRKDIEAGPKATTKADKGKKWTADEESPEPGPSQKKWVKSKLTEVLEINEPKAGGSGEREAGAKRYSGLENKLERLIEATGLIANNLASLFKLHETTVKNSGCIANALESLLDESYGYGMVVSPSDLGSSELDSNELREEAKWLKNHGEDEEGEAKGEDEDMAK
ncbi:hypothetical protein M404DRAFT_35989 [Pisolithus tinctorius Marx 270]|uniref:Uncharacterized protein n=1 Tax=Pisolithus tinctorius Marx 270 TaxID=870435 RepID=A0A0C3NCJ7_PISTI|nr:hypothetical protein M404DRAFT_35989 [Pisolithus tinctorius Marx 270]